MEGSFERDELLLKCLQGKADDHEYEIAYNWINSSPDNLDYYKQLRDAWLAAGIIKSKDQYDCSKAWKRISRRTGIRLLEIPKINSTWRSIAAVFFIAFSLGALGYHFFKIPDEFRIEREYRVQAPLGSKTYLILPDSTSVWLNAGSTLSYSTHYDVSQRNVHLTGEAYFNVETNHKVPFRVHTSDLVINALGTEFNVKAYPEENYVETTLVSGLVSIERTNEELHTEKIILKPNQRASLLRGEAKVTDVSEVVEEIKKDEEVEDEEINIAIGLHKPVTEKILVENVVKPEIYTSWKDRRLIFESEKMADLAVKLQRIYDVKITFSDEELKNYRLTGSLEQETIEEVLYAIRLTIPLDFHIKNRNVVFTLNKELQEKYKKFSE